VTGRWFSAAVFIERIGIVTHAKEKAVSQLSSVVRFIRQIKSSEEVVHLTDASLIARFVANRDEAAFGALVKRHSAMVMAVCRRILADHHRAEDAMQACFLVLARKAACIKRRRALASWLE
jgi:hypothetical protein